MKNVTNIIIIIICLFRTTFSQSDNFNTEKFQYLSPIPGSSLIRPETNIIVRFGEAYLNANITDTSLIHVTGSLSGKHNGKLYLTGDSKTLIFLPDFPFTKNESVFVELAAKLKTITNKDIGPLRFYFNISKGIESSGNIISFSPAGINIQNHKIMSKHSQTLADSSLLFPADYPKVCIAKTVYEKGSYFLGINQGTNNYLSIIDYNGFPIYYKKNVGDLYDFKIQPSGILTYFDDSKKLFYGMDSLYQVVDSFYCKNGYSTDFHDLQVLPDGHSFLISFDEQPINMSTLKAGGDTAAVVIGSIIQEINADKVVIWQWRSWDHFKITDADSSLVDFYQHKIEYCHINSIDVVDNDRLILSSRILNEITMVNRNTGNIMWRFGGLNNQFSGNKIKFQFQHDARLVGNNKLSVFDNANFIFDESSRALVFKIDEQNKTAVLENDITHTPEVTANNMGNIQYTNNTFFVGWGNTGNNTYYISGFDSTGVTLFNDSLKSKTFIYSYRAFKFPWTTKIITTNLDSLLFPKTSLQAISTDSLTVTNNSSEPIDISGIFYRNSAFIPTDTFPIEILPGKNVCLHFNFQPANTVEIRDTIYIVAGKNEETASLPIILIGNLNSTSIINKNLNMPQRFSLEQNYPNPFNASTKISYFLSSESEVIIKIYNILGEVIKTLINDIKPAGKHQVAWAADNFPSGIYFYRIQATSKNGKKSFSATKKMLLLK